MVSLAYFLVCFLPGSIPCSVAYTLPGSRTRGYGFNFCVSDSWGLFTWNVFPVKILLWRWIAISLDSWMIEIFFSVTKNRDLRKFRYDRNILFENYSPPNYGHLKRPMILTVFRIFRKTKDIFVNNFLKDDRAWLELFFQYF